MSQQQAPLPFEVEEKLKVYRALQGDIQLIYGKKQQILSQMNENTLVKGELDLLVANSQVMKLVGPILIPVELEEAKENVGKRLEFIESEVAKIEAAIDVKQKELKGVGEEISGIQQRMQAEAATAARAIAATAMA
mmetsp:Transcript_22192/g.21419  ORF Transcript_22192/g.21419 Transcript_22192/m.21419 type:complete len:136 (+) Transcript_22192:50-457(+)|eukprot:CAMPEP_0119042344 /NCGR_PEP_ID=MMETSP1177-20130426/14642_1 /TAXON_ID=2985 /ORGANISM="Ochromonas sp, Strain CCMP1899" /LENGTH=135 /DNA_ID=CAMNT_0007009065 /DNA_START=48 /DNA_END=455 /DNA_ORIENTATION=-